MTLSNYSENNFQKFYKVLALRANESMHFKIMINIISKSFNLVVIATHRYFTIGKLIG